MSLVFVSIQCKYQHHCSSSGQGKSDDSYVVRIFYTEVQMKENWDFNG